jgi:hypothetical protein
MTDFMDTRIRDRYVQKGKITRGDVEKFLKELPDTGPNSEFVDYEKMFEEERAASLEANRAADGAPKP